MKCGAFADAFVLDIHLDMHLRFSNVVGRYVFKTGGEEGNMASKQCDLRVWELSHRSKSRARMCPFLSTVGVAHGVAT